MTRATFEMDNLMPDWTDDFDFGAFLNLPPDDVDQGVEDGADLHSDSLGSKCSGHSPTAWTWDESGHASDSIPNLCDERRLDVPRHSHGPNLFDPFEDAEAHQSTNFRLQTNNASPGFGYGASNLYGDEIGASGCVRPASAKILKRTGSGTIAIGDYGEVCTIPSEQESSPSLASDLASPEASASHCACFSCLHIGSLSRLASKYENQGYKCRFPGCLTSATNRYSLCHHERSHYETDGNYKCLEQNCQAVTKQISELKRHYKKHCTSPYKQQFPCPVLWCKYSGNNGFLRKDKLQSHYRNIHEGKPGPAKSGRVIKPATLKPRISGLGNGPSKQNE